MLMIQGKWSPTLLVPFYFIFQIFFTEDVVKLWKNQR